MAILKHVQLIKSGPDVWNAWRLRNSEIPDLSEARLGDEDLGRAELSAVDLHEANLSGADLAVPTSGARTYGKQTLLGQTSYGLISVTRTSFAHT